ncbi:PREDICTED: proline-rich protein 2-like [Lepidothrix coronata]|uniref:Proline-rich protein 2-like n=1 Tax=Lepidothrix coronata TaxID=321398 RepID=A0A6J0IWV4_9PASS|nr:PREDICTED: proline-rich protein 2-like [Lepidothrix coronata]
MLLESCENTALNRKSFTTGASAGKQEDRTQEKRCQGQLISPAAAAHSPQEAPDLRGPHTVQPQHLGGRPPPSQGGEEPWRPRQEHRPVRPERRVAHPDGHVGAGPLRQQPAGRHRYRVSPPRTGPPPPRPPPRAHLPRSCRSCSASASFSRCRSAVAGLGPFGAAPPPPHRAMCRPLRSAPRAAAEARGGDQPVPCRRPAVLTETAGTALAAAGRARLPARAAGAAPGAAGAARGGTRRLPRSARRAWPALPSANQSRWRCARPRPRRGGSVPGGGTSMPGAGPFGPADRGCRRESTPWRPLPRPAGPAPPRPSRARSGPDGAWRSRAARAPSPPAPPAGKGQQPAGRSPQPAGALQENPYSPSAAALPKK